MGRTARWLCLCLLLIVLAGCAPGPNTAEDTARTDGVVAGFWRGLWHGVIVPVTFVISLFTPNVAVYEVHNNGSWYDFGFLLGISGMFGGGVAGSSRKKKWK